MRMRRLPWIWIALACACTPIRPLTGDDGGGGADAATRDAGAADRDAGGRDAGSMPLPDAGPGCAGGETRCAGDELETCDDAGLWQTTTCVHGCAGDPAACRQMVPSNLPAGIPFGIADVTVMHEVDRAWEFDTDTGRIDDVRRFGRQTVRPAGSGTINDIHFERVSGRNGQPDLGVFAMRSLSVPAGQRLFGTGDAALVILAEDSVRIDGLVSVDGRYSVGLALGDVGAASGASGAAPGGSGGGRGGGLGASGDDGGGGGAFGSQGGHGGGMPGDVGPTPYGTPELVPLYGGSGGGAGGGSGAGRGGRGGGAVQISALGSITVGSDGQVSACGQGGLGGGGTSSVPAFGGGGGGGSGGAVLLEAPSVTIDGLVGANGGAGGQGSVVDTSRGTRGDDGAPDQVPANGSGTVPPGGGGGDGSTARGAAEAGAISTYGGGGGGGAGRVRVNNLDGVGPYDGVTPRVGSGSTIGQITLAP